MGERKITNSPSTLGVRMGKLEDKVAELEKGMAIGFNTIDKALDKIANSIALQAANAQAEYDKRYSTRQDDMETAMRRLDNPEYRTKASGIIDDWVESEHGCEKLGKAYSYWLDKSRDSATKWINLIKLVIGLAISFAAIYSGSEIVKTQKDSQKAISVIMQELQK